MSDAAKGEILEAIRTHLGRRPGAPVPEAPPLLPPEEFSPWPSSAPPREQTAHFVQMLEKVGVRVHRVPDVDGARYALTRIIAELGASRVVFSDAPSVKELDPDGSGRPIARSALFEADVGVSGAQAGIAETGSLLLDASVEQHRLVSLVPPCHVAVLSSSHIVGTLDDALRMLEEREAGPPALATLVTGPSRTADIELTLVVGVHGPRELHVILMDEGVPA